MALFHVDTDTHSVNYAHNGKLLLCSATLLFFIYILFIFRHTYTCSCFRRRPPPRRRRRHNQHLFTSPAADPHVDLNPSLLKLLPTFTYSSATHHHLQECAVCLSEFEEGDDGRVLRNCNHCFHTACIDTWLCSQSNCPICRALVQPPKILLEKTEVAVSGGELASCSYLPPPISCPRKELDLDMLNVIMEA